MPDHDEPEFSSPVDPELVAHVDGVSRRVVRGRHEVVPGRRIRPVVAARPGVLVEIEAQRVAV